MSARSAQAERGEPTCGSSPVPQAASLSDDDFTKPSSDHEEAPKCHRTTHTSRSWRCLRCRHEATGGRSSARLARKSQDSALWPRKNTPPLGHSSLIPQMIKEEKATGGCATKKYQDKRSLIPAKALSQDHRNLRRPAILRANRQLVLTLLILTMSCQQFLVGSQAALASLGDDAILSTAFKQRAQQQQQVASGSASEQPAGDQRLGSSPIQLHRSEQEEQKNHQQFKYHLNHLRPPSLVPITIQQVAAHTPASGPQEPGALGATGAAPDLAALTLVEPAPHGHNSPLGSGARSAGDKEQQAAAGNRLLQLQLPLQLHLKLRPLPLPMPPPTSRNAVADSQDSQERAPSEERASADKRKRSLSQPAEQVAASSTLAPVALAQGADSPGANELSAAKSSSETQAKKKKDTLLALTWREAKRILLLSSMSPVHLHQARLDRRIADLPGDDAASATDESSTTLAPTSTTVQAASARHLAALSTAEHRAEPQVAAKITTPTRRSETVTTATPATTTTTSVTFAPEKKPSEAPPPSARSRRQFAPSNSNSNSATAGQQQVAGKSEEQVAAKTVGEHWSGAESTERENMAGGGGEVRRQRHSAQQELESTDSRIQALAASMLPLFWPSFQLAGPPPNRRQVAASFGVAPKLQAEAPSRTEPSSAPSSTGSPMAASNFVPTIVSLDDSLAPPRSASITTPSRVRSTTAAPTTTTSTTTSTTSTTTTSTTTTTTTSAPKVVEPQPGKKRQRKPGYLQQRTGVSSTPYPDSTRLASKYPLPRIKFQARGLPEVDGSQGERQQVVSLNGSSQVASGTGGYGSKHGHASLKSKLPEGKLQHLEVHVPKGLSKLIEQQLLQNATKLLLQHKQSQQKHSHSGLTMAPTTSTSKVIRLRNETNDYHLELTKGNSPASPGHHHQLVQIELERHRAAPAPTTTTPMPRPAAKETQVAPTERSISISSTTSTSSSAPTSTSTMAPLISEQPPPTRPARATGSQSQAKYGGKKSGGGKRAHQQEPSESSANPVAAASLNLVALEDPIGSNKVLPEVEEEHAQANKSARHLAAAPLNSGQRRQKDEPRKFGGQQVAGGLEKGKNIKLFHFKRKPDMNKLPFYKKPLNYTELGWTSRQIQEHLESVAALTGNTDEGSASASVSQTSLQGLESLDILHRKRRGKNQFERLIAELHGETSSGELPSARPNGELASASEAVEQQQQMATATEANSATGGRPTLATGLATSSAAPTRDEPEQRVPVLRKKAEPLVMKPMFFVMNQKRLRSSSSAPSLGSSSPATPPPDLSGTPTTTPTPASADTAVVEDELIGRAQASQNKSKPIIRMRRKHHGDQPPAPFFRASPALELMTPAGSQPWRPTRPLWSAQKLGALVAPPPAPASSVGPGERLLLVPSSLLTPSGSHLVPLYTEAQSGRVQQQQLLSMDEQSRLVNDLFAWRPARAQSDWAASGGGQTDLTAAMRKPSDGLAPSGEESFLVAPSAPAASQQQGQGEPTPGPSERLVAEAAAAGERLSQQAKATAGERSAATGVSGLAAQVAGAGASGQQQNSSAGQGADQLRVPKLLVKPARPAKYSLNGYIPKPSLSGLQAQAPLAAQVWPTMRPAGGAARPQRPAVGGSSRPRSPATQAGKDLDSSTSNEIFSRRRGLQQHQRVSGKLASQANALSLFQEKATNNHKDYNQTTNLPLSNANLSPMQRQMEENKRKYIAQQQQQLGALKSPTLSVQKANQIKAKLGLLVSGSAIAGVSPQQQSDQQRQTSTNSIVTADPGEDGVNAAAANALPAASRLKSEPLIGAPLNSIPKTDFECTDRQGKFVSGLFADQKTGCQVWHLCSNNRKYSFLCPSGTIFNAKLRICDWRYNVKCENSLPF